MLLIIVIFRSSRKFPYAERYLQRKTKLEKCSAETVYKLAKALGVSMELLTEQGILQVSGSRPMNMGFRSIFSMIWMLIRKGLKNHSTFIAWGELYGSINIAQINSKSMRRNTLTTERNACLEETYD